MLSPASLYKNTKNPIILQEDHSGSTLQHEISLAQYSSAIQDKSKLTAHSRQDRQKSNLVARTLDPTGDKKRRSHSKNLSEGSGASL